MNTDTVRLTCVHAGCQQTVRRRIQVRPVFVCVPLCLCSESVSLFVSVSTHTSPSQDDVANSTCRTRMRAVPNEGSTAPYARISESHR